MTRTASLRFVLLWLSGNCLRLTVLAVPPVLPTIHRQLHLSESLVGALTALPVLLLAAGAVFGSLLVARLGARRALLLGLTLVAIGGAARGLVPSAGVLFGMTVVMGIGVAVSQPALPSLVKRWFPQRTALATAIYANGLLIGEIAAASLTVPLVMPLVADRWEPALAFWSLPVGVTIAALWLTTRHEPRDAGAPPVRWWPDWYSAQTWRLGLILGCASAAYFGSNAFIPDYLKVTHHADLIPVALTSVNLSQLPASLLAAAVASRFVGRRYPFVLTGAILCLSAAGCVLGGAWVVLFAGMLGFSTALVLVLSLALAPILTSEDDVHRLTAAMFTISYGCSFGGSLLGGAIWDATGTPAVAFAPVGASGVIMVLLTLGLKLRPSSNHPADMEPMATILQS